MKEIPVYLACGFLESGKTDFLKGILEDTEFTERKKTLVIVCEEGEEEYDDALLKDSNAVVEIIESEDDVTRGNIEALVKKHKPEIILIEYNGTWSAEKLLSQIPKGTPIVQMFTLIDAGTYDVYMQNMRGIIMNFVRYSDVVIVNRCTAETKKSSIRRTMKGANPRVMVVYENADGVSSDEVEDDLPFDVNADKIEIEDEDFGIFYLEAMEHPEKFANKTVSFKAMVYWDDQMPKGWFYAGRYAMTCCEADISYVGIMVKWNGAEKLPSMGFVNITGEISIEANEMYTAPGPVVHATMIMPGKTPDEKLVYFS